MNPDGANPLVPTTGEAALVAAGLIAVCLFVVAVLSLAKDRHHSPARRFLWLFIVVAVPVVGPLLWLAVAPSRSSNRRSSNHRPLSAQPSDPGDSSHSLFRRDGGATA